MKIACASGVAEMRDARGDVGLDAVLRRLLDVRHVLEVVAALLGSGRASEVVERDRRVAALGEAQRELLVEAVEAADVGQDHDSGAVGSSGVADERREAVAVRGLEHEVVVGHGRTR